MKKADWERLFSSCYFRFWVLGPLNAPCPTATLQAFPPNFRFFFQKTLWNYFCPRLNINSKKDHDSLDEFLIVFAFVSFSDVFESWGFLLFEIVCWWGIFFLLFFYFWQMGHLYEKATNGVCLILSGFWCCGFCDSYDKSRKTTGPTTVYRGTSGIDESSVKHETSLVFPTIHVTWKIPENGFY